ncbi:MAG TPA: ATP-binding protein [Alphaproteobacteria bacterium]
MTAGRRKRALVAWSSGKDSAYALHLMRQDDGWEIAGLLTTVSDAYDRVAMHGVREALLDAQAEAAGLPLIKVRIPSPCPNEVYERAMGEAMAAALAQGVDHVVFGDLFLADIRAYREAQLAKIGMTPVFPLWRRDTATLAREMIAAGMAAVLTCVDPRQLDPAFAGRTFDGALLDALPPTVDPCGENGEFHTLVTAGPMFRHPIRARVGEVVTRDGFVFADVLPAETA